MALATVLGLCTTLIATSAGTADAGSTGMAYASPTVVGVRAAKHAGFDRLVFEFRGGLPAYREVRYVQQVLGAGSGEPVRLAGRAKLQVEFRNAVANDGAGHPTVPYDTAYALKNIHEVVLSGDYEGETSFGVGLSKATALHVFTLRSPDRVVIDVSTRYRAVPVKVWLVDQAATTDWSSPKLRPVSRLAATPRVAAGALDRLFAGATPAEQLTGLRSRSFTPTGWTKLSIRQGVARVQLTGQCEGQIDRGLGDEITLTLKQFPTVKAVKIYDPSGETLRPYGAVDSVPQCLQG